MFTRLVSLAVGGAVMAAAPPAPLGTSRQQVRRAKQELDRAKHGIILFHDIHEQTVIVLPHLLAELRARHIKTVVFVAAAKSGAPAGPAWER